MSVPLRSLDPLLRTALRPLMWRVRMERALHALSLLAYPVLALSLIGMGVMLVDAHWFSVITPALLAFIFLGVLTAALLGLFLPVSPRKVCLRSDRQLRLSDAVLSAATFLPSTSEMWRSAQLRQTLECLRESDLKSAWPIVFDRRLVIVYVASVLACACILLLSLSEYQRRRTEDSNRMVEAVFQREVTEDIFENWEAFQAEHPTSEMKKLLERVEPLRERIVEAEFRNKELILELNGIQDYLQVMHDRFQSGLASTHSGEVTSAIGIQIAQIRAAKQRLERGLPPAQADPGSNEEIVVPMLDSSVFEGH